MGVCFGLISEPKGGRTGLRPSTFGLNGCCRSDDGEVFCNDLDESGAKNSLRSGLGPAMSRSRMRPVGDQDRAGAARPGGRIRPGTGRCLGGIGRFSREPWVGPDGSPENRARNTAAISVSWQRFSREYTRSNNNRTAGDAVCGSKRTPWLRMAQPASSMRGVWNPRPPRRSDKRLAMYGRWGMKAAPYQRLSRSGA